MPPYRVLVVFGTRAEAIKLCVLIRRLQTLPHLFAVRACVTAQHRSMLDQVLQTFEVKPDYDLDLMKERQTLGETVASILVALDPLLTREKPDLVLVQGDTSTAFAAALAAFYARIPVAHVEAGLRTGDRRSPFPEEINRRFIACLADLHFAATRSASLNLSKEGVPPGSITVTGNTIVDAMHFVRDALAAGHMPPGHWHGLEDGRKLIVVTAHRRESFGVGLARICQALATLGEREDVRIVFPVHLNPAVQQTVHRLLGGHKRIELCEPLEYASFVDLMTRAYLILTDSGGIQEEAPSLGKPVLVMRNTTERPEGVETGLAKLVGTDPATIVRETAQLLDDPGLYRRMTPAANPYGDGRACERIIDVLTSRAAAAPPREQTKKRRRALVQALG
jgi:UDP-N-acetylglucosamine 2-epimerase (non-hydrolysing)